MEKLLIVDDEEIELDGLAFIRAAQQKNCDTVFVVLSDYGDYEYTS